MPTLLERKKRLALPNTEEATLARQSSQALTRLLAQETRPSDPHFCIVVHEVEVQIPPAALPLIAQLLAEMGKGKPVMALSADQELTPNQAAAYLGMSRPFLLRLLDNGVIPQRRVGTHRRLKLQDVLAFQQEKERQGKIMDELVAQAQELHMGY